MKNTSIIGVRIPDSNRAQAATELVRDTESDLLFHHSTRVFYWGVLARSVLSSTSSAQR